MVPVTRLPHGTIHIINASKFTEADLELVHAYVELNFKEPRGSRQFEALSLFLIRLLSARIKDHYELSGCYNSVQWWLDTIGPSMIFDDARAHAVLRPLVEVGLSADSVSSAKQCGMCKTKFERGELFLMISPWFAVPWEGRHIASYKQKRCCLAPSCLAKPKWTETDWLYNEISYASTDEMLADAKFEETLCAEARDVATAALVERGTRVSKPSQRFAISKKRKGAGPKPSGFGAQVEAHFEELTNARWAKFLAAEDAKKLRCACGSFANSQTAGATCNVCAA